MSIFTVIGVKSFAQLGRLCLASNSRPSAWYQIASTQDLVTSFWTEEGTPLEVDNSYTRIKKNTNTEELTGAKVRIPWYDDPSGNELYDPVINVSLLVGSNKHIHSLRIPTQFRLEQCQSACWRFHSKQTTQVNR